MQNYSIRYKTSNEYDGSAIVRSSSLHDALLQTTQFMPEIEGTTITSITRLMDDKLLYSTNSDDFLKGDTMDAAIVTNVQPELNGKLYLRLENGQNTGDVLPYNPEGFFHPDIKWVEIPFYLKDWITDEYLITDKGVVPPSMDYFADQVAYVAKNIRKGAIENGSVSYKGHTFPTNEKAFATVGSKLNYIQSAKQERAWSEEWKSNTGFITFNYADLVELNKLMHEYQASAFKREKSMADQFRSRKVGDLEDIITNMGRTIGELWAM